MSQSSRVSRQRVKALIVSGFGVVTLLGGLVLPLWSVLHQPTANTTQTQSRTQP